MERTRTFLSWLCRALVLCTGEMGDAVGLSQSIRWPGRLNALGRAAEQVVRIALSKLDTERLRVIALAGLDAETGLVMLLYRDNGFERFRRDARMRNADDLWVAVHDGAVKRLRPKSLTVMTTFIGLVPLLWATGAGADTMRRLAAPMIGGLATSCVMELPIYPVIFFLAKRIAMAPEWRRSAHAVSG